MLLFLLFGFAETCALLGQVVKKGIFGPKERKHRQFGLIIEKLIFWCLLVFCVFSFFGFLCVLLFLFLFLFSGGFKGQVMWPKGPPHLALNPPYLFCFVFCFVLCSVSLGGFKGQVRWPKGPPRLSLNPPDFVWFL